MAIATFDELKTAIQSWMLERSDLSAKLEDFIDLAERDMLNGGGPRGPNRVRPLRTWQMEATATITSASFTDGVAALPADFLQSRYLHPTSTPGRPLLKATPDALLSLYPTAHSGIPKHYSIQGDGQATPGLQVDVRPYPTTDLTLGYYQKIPQLSGAQTANWVLLTDPYCYLAGSLMYAAKFIRWYEDAGAFGADFKERVDNLNSMDMDARWGNSTSSHQGQVRI